MEFLAIADLHLTTETPRSRKFGYSNQILKKFEQILILTKNKTTSNLLLIAGDFFDSPHPVQVPYSLTSKVIEIIKKHNVTIFVVPGQHDLRYHTKGLQNTPLGTLQSAGVIKILNGKEKTYHDIMPEYSFVGQGWDEKLIVKDADVLITHRMVVKNKLWKDQTDYITAKALMKKYPNISCIISGDNHLPHFLKTNNRLQINCGSIPRKTKLQVDYQPYAWKVNLETRKVTKIKIKVLPKNEVFDFEKIEKTEKETERKNAALEKIPIFIQQLFDKNNKAPTFPVILRKLIKEMKPNQDVQNIINTTMENLK